jgi:hypothetical protein
MNAAIVQAFDERPFASLIVIGNRHGRGDIGGARHHGQSSNATVTSCPRGRRRGNVGSPPSNACYIERKAGACELTLRFVVTTPWPRTKLSKEKGLHRRKSF